TAIPAAGQTITETIGGSTITALPTDACHTTGSPIVISHIIQPDEVGNIGLLVLRLEYLIDSQCTELAHVHVFASANKASSNNQFLLFYPADETVTLTASGNLTVTQTTGTASSGSTATLTNYQADNSNAGTLI